LAGGSVGTVHGNITITYDSRGIAHARDDLGRFVSMSSLVNNQLDRDTKRGSRSFNLFGKQILKWTGIIFGGIAALQSLLSIIQVLIVAVTALGPAIGGSLALLPGIILTAAAAFGILKLALVGVGDAFKAALEGDAEKFNEALEKLSPNARQTAVAFRDLVTAVKPIQQAIQNAFFGNVAPQVNAIRAQIGGLTPEAVGVASAFNTVLRAVLGVLGTNQSLAAMRQIMFGLRGAVEALAPGLASVVRGFIVLGGQIGLFSGSATAAIGGFLERFGKAMEAINLAAVLDNAQTVLQGIGSFLQDIGTIASNVFGALTSQSTGALGPISAIVSKVAEFTESTAGSAALNALGMAMQAIAGAVGQALLALLQALAPAITAIAPLAAQLAQLLGGILTTAFQILGPIVTQLVSTLAGALAPVLPQIAAAFQTLAPVIGRLVTVLGGVLGPLLAGLAPVLGQLATTLSQVLLAALEAVLPSLEAYVPVFAQLAQEMLPQLVPLIQQLGRVFIALAPAIGTTLNLFVGILLPLMQAASPIILALVAALSFLVGILATVIGWISQLIAKFITIKGVVAVVQGVVNALAGPFIWLFNLLIGNSIIPDLINGIFAAFRRLTSLPGQVAGYFRSMASAVGSAIGSLLSVVGSIPGQISGALSGLGGLLVGAGRSIIQGLVNGIRSMVGAVRDAVSDVMSAARNLLPFSPAKEGPFSGRGWTLYSGRSMMTDLAKGLTQGASAVQAAMAGALGGLASTVTVNGSTGVSGTSTVAATPTVATGPALTVHQTVNALPGMDAQQVGDYTLRRLSFGVLTGTSSVVDAVGGA